MLKNRGPMELNEHLTDTETMWAIRHLDPDLCAGTTRNDTGTAVGICIMLLTG